MSSTIAGVPGTVDLFPEESERRVRLESAAREVFARYGYGEIRVPMFERTEVFARAIGESTDIVQKEMYTFTDRGGRSLTLRPEGTASVIRAVVNRGLGQHAYRLFYLGPMLRNERPQKGRLRQFHQVGAEAIGRVNAATDAEMIAMVVDLLEAAGLAGLRIRVNTVGAPGDRPAVIAAYREFFAGRIESMCDDCRRRFETNVLRILDCKRPECADPIAAAPSVASILPDESRTEFETTLDLLRSVGINPDVEPRLVRGLDYYVHTVYEVAHPGLGAQDSLVGGGRYRIDLGGETVDGTGFAVGVERVLLALDAEDAGDLPSRGPDAYVVTPGASALSANFELARRLRRDGLRVRMDLEGRSVKAQMRAANRERAAAVVIRGDDELDGGIAVVRVMTTGDEDRVAIDELADRLRRIVADGEQGPER